MKLNYICLLAAGCMICHIGHGFELSELTTFFSNKPPISVQTENGKIEAYEFMLFNYSLDCVYLNSILKLSNASILYPHFDRKADFMLATENKNIAGIFNESVENYMMACEKSNIIEIPIQAGHIGITHITVKEILESASTFMPFENLPIAEIRIKRKVSFWEELAVLVMTPIILLNKCAFGAKIEVSVLREILLHPTGLFLCLLLQFCIMPLLAIICSSLFGLSDAIALALFVVATCPGGGGGYIFSFLINGDITLAISGSLLSTLFGIAAMPLLLGAYEHFAHVPTSIAIPYFKIIFILFAIAGPISSGMFLNKRFPKFAEKFILIIKPVSLFLVLCGFIYLGFSCQYIIYGPKVGWILCPLIPLMMFTAGVGLSRLFGLNWPFAKAVALESGMKNTVLAIAVIELSFPQPEADLASLMILLITIGHTIIPLLWYFGYILKQKFITKNRRDFIKVSTVNPDSDSDTDETKLIFTTSVK